MTVEMLVAVIVLLVVKYTLEFADRTRPRRRRSALKRGMAARRAPSFVVDFGARDSAAPADVRLTADHTTHTPPAFWNALVVEMERAARRGEDWRALLDERIAGMQQLRSRWREPAGERD